MNDRVYNERRKLFRLRLHNSTRYSDYVSITKCNATESEVKLFRFTASFTL